MKDFNVNGCVTVSCNTRVKANSAEEALEIAKERYMADLTINAFDEDLSSSFHVEVDGEPQDLTVEEA